MVEHLLAADHLWLVGRDPGPSALNGQNQPSISMHQYLFLQAFVFWTSERRQRFFCLVLS
jgi:hypothetical protein